VGVTDSLEAVTTTPNCMVTMVPKTQKQANTTYSMGSVPKLHLSIPLIVVVGFVELVRQNVL